MLKMWDQAKKYDNLAQWGDKKLKRFGWKKFLPVFSRIRAKIAYYKDLRYNYVMMAIAMSKKLSPSRKLRIVRD